MPWMSQSRESLRREFVSLAGRPNQNMSVLCKRFGISRKTGYKWLKRADSGEEQWFRDRSRRPHHCPNQTSEEMEERIVSTGREFPYWGARKIRQILLDRDDGSVPSSSTTHEVLQRHGRQRISGTAAQTHFQRFERGQPNELWQMDFKSPVRTLKALCNPLTIVDDHSRYSVCVEACADQRRETVQPVLSQVFRRYGMPSQMLMDNGACWGRSNSRYTKLGAWLIQLGIQICHGRAYHPQTQGKNERFNRTLQLEALQGRQFVHLDDCQSVFDEFRHRYNHVRPHESLDFKTPAHRYRVSPLCFPEELPIFEYSSQDLQRKVLRGGAISFQSVFYQVGRAFAGQPVALRATEEDGTLAVYFCHQQVALIDLRTETVKPC